MPTNATPSFYKTGKVRKLGAVIDAQPGIKDLFQKIVQDPNSARKGNCQDDKGDMREHPAVYHYQYCT